MSFYSESQPLVDTVVRLIQMSKRTSNHLPLTFHLMLFFFIYQHLRHFFFFQYLLMVYWCILKVD